MSKQEFKVCSICQAKYYGFGDNADPVNDGECCELCNLEVVLPARVRQSRREQDPDWYRKNPL